MSGEFALGILPQNQRASVAAHLLRCPNCRRKIAPMTAIGVRLLELIPGREPPLGFAVVGAGGLGGQPARASGLAAQLRQEGHTVGVVYAGGRPAWVTMTIRGDTASGPVTCELLGRNGTVTKLGTFDLGPVLLNVSPGPN